MMAELTAALAPLTRRQLQDWLVALPPGRRPLARRWKPEGEVWQWRWRGRTLELHLEWPEGLYWETPKRFPVAEEAELEALLLAPLRPAVSPLLALALRLEALDYAGRERWRAALPMEIQPDGHELLLWDDREQWHWRWRGKRFTLVWDVAVGLFFESADFSPTEKAELAGLLVAALERC